MFHVSIARPEGYPHSRVFDRVARSFERCLHELKLHDVSGIEIVFGAHLLAVRLSRAGIIFNTEVASGPWMVPQYIERLRSHAVLDYSTENIKVLKERYGISAVHCPIRYHPSLEDCLQGRTEDIDVLFYGSPTPRRLEIWHGVWEAVPGAVWIGHDEWDKHVDAIERAKIVLNMHAYDGSPFEIFRVGHLLANKKFVISEWPAEDEYGEFVIFHEPANMAAAVKQWLEKPGTRAAVAELGYERFRSKPQAAALRTALTELGVM